MHFKATRIIRSDMLNTKSKFNGTFNNSFQQESVSESLKTLTGMILGGPDIKIQSSDDGSADQSKHFSTDTFQCNEKALRQQ